MKKTFNYIFILILLIGSVLPSMLQAQTQTEGCWQGGKFIKLGFITKADCAKNGTWVNVGDPTPPPPNGPQADAQPQNQGTCWSAGKAIGAYPNITIAECQKVGKWQPAGAALPPPPDGPPTGTVLPAEGAAVTASGESSCGMWNMWQCVLDMFTLGPGWIAVLVLQIAHLIVWIAGAILNYAVQYSVVDMKENLDKANVVNDAWRVIRDIANMGFIFVLLYAAINTILGRGSDNKKLIVNIVVVAILINFSLFFTKFVIDASNILAMTFYDAIAPGALADNVNRGISTSLMAPLHLQSIMDTTSGLNGSRLFIIGVLGTVFSLIAAFVFFAVALMFIIRFVVLIFVLVLSPIAFVAFALPGLDGKTKEWWDALSGQAFFAPIYFMLTWVVIMVSRGLLPEGGSLGAAIAGGIGANGEAIPPTMSDIGVIVNFLIMIALLITSLTIAKKWSDKAGSAVSGVTKWAMAGAGSASIGIAGWTGRKTIGSWGGNALNDEELKARARSGDMGARLKLATANRMAKSSFDMRATGIGNTLGSGKAQKGGFTQDQKDKAKSFEKYKPGKDAIDKLKSTEAASQKELNDAAERAIPKTQAHLDAEENLKALRRTSTARFSKEEVTAHKAKLDSTREEIEQHNEELNEKRKRHAENAPELENVRARFAENKNARQNFEGSMETMATTSERRGATVKFFGYALPGSGYIVGGKNRADAIRAAAKGKSKKEAAADAAIAAAKEDEPETPPPAAPTTPSP